MTPTVYHSLASPPTLLGVERLAAFLCLGLHAGIFALFTIASQGGSFVLGLFVLNLFVAGFHAWLAAKNQQDPYFLQTLLRSLRYPTAFAARPAWGAPKALSSSWR